MQTSSSKAGSRTEGVPVLRFQNFCASDERLHAMRYHWYPKEDGPEGADSYAWGCMVLGLILAGSGVMAEGDRRHPMECGHFYAMAPQRPFTLRPHPVEGLVEMRVLLRPVWTRRICNRFPEVRPPWADGPLQSIRNLGEDEVQWFTGWVETLMNDRVDELMAESFVLDVLNRSRGFHSPKRSDLGLPAWMRAAMVEMTSASNLAQGANRLVALSGRSARHVNRLCREHLDCTATDLVNRLRMEYAARRLRLTDDGVGDIAETIGLHNRGYFTKLFTASYGTSPGRYRQERR